MKVTYTRRRDGSFLRLYENPVEFCCDGLKQLWETSQGGAIGFGEADPPLHNPEPGVFLYHSIHYPEGGWVEDYKINFCPICAEPIVVEDVTPSFADYV